MQHSANRQQVPQRAATHTDSKNSVEVTVPLFLVGADFAQDIEGLNLALDWGHLKLLLLSIMINMHGIYVYCEPGTVYGTHSYIYYL